MCVDVGSVVTGSAICSVSVVTGSAICSVSSELIGARWVISSSSMSVVSISVQQQPKKLKETNCRAG